MTAAGKLGFFEKRISGGGGFTLIEMMMVVLLLAVLTASTAPLFSGTWRRLSLEKTMGDLDSLCDLARDLAVLRGSPIRFWVEDDRRTCRLQTPSAGQWVPVRDSLTQSRALPDDAVFSQGGVGVVFYPDGASTSLRLDVLKNDKIVYRLTAAPSLGRVKWEETRPEKF